MKDLRVRIIQNENGTYFGRVDYFVKGNWKSQRLTENSYAVHADTFTLTQLIKDNWMLEK